MAVYQTYTNMMNERIRLAHRPFEFKFVRFLRQVENFEDVGTCVMLATPGMLQSGGSRLLLEKWASDAKNGLILAGYSVEGTMARVMSSLTVPLMVAFSFGTSRDCCDIRTEDSKENEC